jgi:hypothetical protein
MTAPAPSVPSWVKYLFGLNAALAFLGVYFGNTYPHIAFDLLGVVGAINAAGVWLGWPTTPTSGGTP